MPGYWLKPFGTSKPRRTVPDSWTERFSPDAFPLMSGPANVGTLPRMSRGDLVLFHATIAPRRAIGAIQRGIGEP